MSYSSADEEIGDLEMRMIRLVKAELDDYENDATEEGSSRPLPPALVQLVLGTHKAVLARLSKRKGLDIEAIRRNPRLALVQLEKERALIMKIIDQTENQGLKVVEGGR